LFCVAWDVAAVALRAQRIAQTFASGRIVVLRISRALLRFKGPKVWKAMNAG
jgi:hypothetical protein